jgi:hypothetical protein
MYSGQVNSPATTLAGDIDAAVTTIPLIDASILPAGPNIATIGNGNNAETIKYTSKVGNSLTGVTRGFQGTAKFWATGEQVARRYTEYDHAAFIKNIKKAIAIGIAMN